MRDAELLQSRIQTLTTVDPYVGRYYSAEWVRRNILQQTKEEIAEIDQQIKQEEQDGTGGPTQQGQEPEVSADQYPPEDNTADNGATESPTPQLDADVEKYSAILNRR